ncbi:MAG: nitrous oxide reductase family maturation protein NosD, partial [Verrucomicrobiae bacterium]|nr:nitrous oxide reductase family maturation protein NosD [Verrucomicrobiae bacterium]
MRPLIPWLLATLPLAAAELRVGAGETHATISSALAAAAAGDTVRVGPGTYRENGLIIDKQIALLGESFPVVDAGGEKGVITVTASGASVRGFDVRASGVSSLEDHAGIKVSGAENVVVSENRVRDCHFGIYLAK